MNYKLVPYSESIDLIDIIEFLGNNTSSSYVILDKPKYKNKHLVPFFTLISNVQHLLDVSEKGVVAVGSIDVDI